MASKTIFDVDVVTGTIDSGDRQSTYEDDSDVLVINEINNPTGFDVRFTWERVGGKIHGEFMHIFIDGYYDGNAGHNVKLFLWNYSTDTFDPVTGDAKDLPDETGQDSYEFIIEARPYVSATREKGLADFRHQVILQIKHTSAGSAAHDLNINRIAIDFRTETGTILEP